MDKQAIFKKIRAVGQAALTVDIENSHSGNIALKTADSSGREFLAITATGSQKGELTEDKICYPDLYRTSHGHYKASSETDIHSRILKIPRASASIHGHTKYATVVTMDDDPMPKQNPRDPMLPIDALGARYLDVLPVDWFAVASGSKEMTDGIYDRLLEHPACMVQLHGVFARGASIEEAMMYLTVAEHSGRVIFYSQILGVDINWARQQVEGLKDLLHKALPDFTVQHDGRVDFKDEPDTADLFLTQGFRCFESRYSPFHTGSMSIRGSSSMLFAPKASMPHGLPGPLLELPINEDLPPQMQATEYNLHQTIYKNTPLKAILHGYVSEAQAIALSLMAQSPEGKGRVIPIDAEGGFLYPSVPVLSPDPDPDELCRALLDYRIAIVPFGGVWSAGEQSLGETVRHLSSIQDICYYRIMARLKGLSLSTMEPARAKSW